MGKENINVEKEKGKKRRHKKESQGVESLSWKRGT